VPGLADLLAVAARNFSRTVSTTFHWRGTDSSVRVTSSPTCASDCGSIHTPLRIDHQRCGEMIGERIAFGARARKSANSRRPGTAFSAASSSSVALASSSSNVSASWSTRRDERSDAVRRLALELGDP